MIILGIDPGTATTGYGILKVKKTSKIKPLIEYVGHGCVLTKPTDIMPKRLLLIRNGIDKIIKKFKPDCAVIEQLFFGVNAKTAMMVGQARGVAILTCAENEVDLFEYQGLKVKRGITGYGRTDKKRMQKIVADILKLPSIPKPDDAADALAIAIYHALNCKQL